MELDDRLAAAVALQVNAFAHVLDERQMIRPSLVEHAHDNRLLGAPDGLGARGRDSAA